MGKCHGKQRPPLLPWVVVRGAGAGQAQGRGQERVKKTEVDTVSVATKGTVRWGWWRCLLSHAMGEHNQKLQAREAERPCVEQV